MNLNTEKQLKPLLFFIFFLIVMRFFSLGMYELADTTESRYASIAMRMVLTNDWITPRYFDQPFLGKPPLSFFATALSFKIFGISEFSARLPHFLLMIAVLLMGFFSLRKHSQNLAVVACFIYTTSAAFLLLAGSVMTEATLVFGLSLVMFSFYEIAVLKNHSSKNRYLFFVGLALCLLTKGLVGIVICGFSIIIFQTKQNRGFFAGIKDFCKKLPVILGSSLAAVIFLPWYIMAEVKNPGFLNYFIFGEHFGRFFIKGWNGDRFGHAHSEPIGMIWLFFLLMTLPWSLYFVGLFVKNIKEIFLSKKSTNSVKKLKSETYIPNLLQDAELYNKEFLARITTKNASSSSATTKFFEIIPAKKSKLKIGILSLIGYIPKLLETRTKSCFGISGDPATRGRRLFGEKKIILESKGFRYIKLLEFIRKTCSLLISNDQKFYFFCWTISPLLLFSFASNIIIPYASLSVLPFSILLALILLEEKSKNPKRNPDSEQLLSQKNQKLLFVIGGFSICLMLIFLAKTDEFKKNSDKKIIEKFFESKKLTLAAYSYGPEHSTYFYSRDKIKILTSETDFKSCKNCFILISEKADNPEFFRLSKIAEKNNSQVANPTENTSKN